MAGTVLMATPGCGASIQAIYEGDVRFERCMARDARPSVSPAERRACWTEWVTHYTYGQTKDRVLHAQLRIQQLEESNDMTKSSATEPDQLEADRGLHPQLGKSTEALTLSPEADRARLARCHQACAVVRDDCLASCEGLGSCGPDCAVGERLCESACK
jgi:hypothetical protein